MAKEASSPEEWALSWDNFLNKELLPDSSVHTTDRIPTPHVFHRVCFPKRSRMLTSIVLVLLEDSQSIFSCPYNSKHFQITYFLGKQIHLFVPKLIRLFLFGSI